MTGTLVIALRNSGYDSDNVKHIGYWATAVYIYIWILSTLKWYRPLMTSVSYLVFFFTILEVSTKFLGCFVDQKSRDLPKLINLPKDNSIHTCGTRCQADGMYDVTVLKNKKYICKSNTS